MGLGEIMALLAAATVACSSVLNKYLTRRMPVVSLNATRTTGAAAFLLILYFAAGAANDLPSVHYEGLALIVAGGLITTLLGDTIFLRFLRTVDVAKTSTMAQALNTLLMVGAGALLLDEDVTLITLLGTGLVVSGIYLLGQTGSSTTEPGKGLLSPRKFFTLLFIVTLWVTVVGLMREGLREVDAFTGNAARMVVISAFLITALGMQQGQKLTAEMSGHRRERRIAQAQRGLPPRPRDPSPAPGRDRDAYTGHAPQGPEAQSDERGVGDTIGEPEPGPRHDIHVRGVERGRGGGDHGDLQRPAADTDAPFDDRASGEVELEGGAGYRRDYGWHHNRDTVKRTEYPYPTPLPPKGGTLSK